MQRPAHNLSPQVLRVLVIEDSLDAVHSSVMLLREMGHIADYAINGYVALEVARKFRPDYILLDIGLPGGNGFEVCRQIRADPELRSVKIVAVTAYSDAKYRERAAAVGFDGYYVKPLLPQTLSDILGEPLQNQPPKTLPHPP